MTAPLPRRLAAEAIGTALLVATVIGSGIMAERLDDGNAALALLCNALATGAMLVVIVTVFAPISGAHFNPAVSAVMAVRGGLPARELAPYVAAQTAGAVLGAIVAHLMFDLPALAIGDHARNGVGQWLGEGVATFALVLVILLAVRNARAALPWLVGLVIVAAYWFTSSTSFANPAVTLARGLTRSFAGIALGDVPAFIVAQLIGAAIAAVAATALLGRSDPAAKA